MPPASRPVILPDYAELEFRISEDARSPALVALDGKVFTDLDVGDSGERTLFPPCLSIVKATATGCSACSATIAGTPVAA